MEKEITKVSLTVEIDGNLYFVALPQDRLLLLVNLAKSLSDNQKLPVRKAPDNFKFIDL